MAALLSAARLSRISSVLTLFFHRLCYNIFYGVGYYTHSTMAGFIRLEPRDLDEDPTGLTVTLSMPKQYVEKDSIRIPPFSTNSTVTEYTIGSVEGNGANYTISIYFTVYDRTQTLMLPFTLSFLDDVVPDNYRLPVTASVSGGDAAAPTNYRPLYKDWEIQKFVNSNRLDAFRKDGAEVVVTPQEEGGNPYLDDLTYVDFAFIVNKYTNDQCGLADLRDARSVTLTDTLPTYTDRNGVSRIAVFDADQNPGWTLSEDRKTVSRTYTGEHSAEILLQIYNDALHLRFPGLQFTALADGTLEADLDNTVHLEAIPSGEAPGETHPEADDPLRFRLTTDPTTQGKFAKGAEKGDIYDVEVYKTNPYPWSLALSNGKSQPLRHIVIQDRTIVENDEVVLAELDEALRFVRLESVTTGATLPERKTYADLVDHITAYYTDGTIQPISALQADAHGNIAVTFDEEKVCDGYDIVFTEDYEMQAGGQVRFQAYTVYRDPEHTHVPDGQTKVTYTNAARYSPERGLRGRRQSGRIPGADRRRSGPLRPQQQRRDQRQDRLCVLRRHDHRRPVDVRGEIHRPGRVGQLEQAGTAGQGRIRLRLPAGDRQRDCCCAYRPDGLRYPAPHRRPESLRRIRPRLGIPGPPARRHHAAGGLYGLLHHQPGGLHLLHGGDGERRYLGSHSLRLRIRHRLQARRRGRDRAGRELKIPGPDPGMRAEDL